MTKDEWIKAILDLGCIVCFNNGINSQPDVHHITKNHRRVSDLHTIPLCPSHHRAGINNQIAASRHPWKKEFERRYGNEWDLWEQTKNLLEMRQAFSRKPSKDKA